MILSRLRPWTAIALVVAAGAIGTAAQVAGPIIGYGIADRTSGLSAPASIGDQGSGLDALPGALQDDGVPDVLVGPDNGSRVVRLLSGADGSELASGYPFGPAFTGGVRLAYTDLTGDGAADPIVAMGVGGGLVRLYDGADLTNILSGYPFGSTFTGGVFVATGDVSGDGRADVVVAQGQAGGEVRVYDAADGTLLASGSPFGSSYSGGVRVAAGDVNGDGRAEVIAAQASGGLVSVINGVDHSVLVSGFPYGAGFTGGIFVAAGDVNADGHSDVIVAPGTGNGPVIVVDGATSAVLGTFPAYAPGFSGGVRVATADLTGDGRADIVTAPGGGGLPLLQVFDGATFSLTAQALVYDSGFSGGLFVAAPPSSGLLRFTSASTTTFTVGAEGTFSITTAGVPPATSVTEAGGLPSGVTFTDNGDGTATLTGSPAMGSAGTYSLTFTATNGVGPAATQTFTLEVVDAPPRVTATSPAEGATGIPIDLPLVVTFSEPVNVTPGAFSLECSPGTPVAVTVPTASPATEFTIDPAVDLPTSTACSLRIAADQVTDADADDPPDTLAADVTVSFTTSACAAITVSPTTLVGGNVSLAYGPISFTQVGGAAPIAWSVTSGALPPGLTLAGDTGVLSGTPTASGAFPFTITATAASGCTGAVELTLNIASGPNQAPSFAVGPNQTTAEDGGAQGVAGWATAISPGPPDEAGQTVAFNVTGNTNGALFDVAPAVSPTGTLTYTPAANANGTATITLVLQDNGGTALGGVDTSAPQSFTITVNAVNDAPSFAVGADQAVAENAAAQTVAGWATALSAGPADEASQTLTFAITNNSNPALFSTGPAVSSSGELTYTPAPDASGTATVMMVLEDNGGTADGGVDTSAPQSFTITVNGVNSAPSFSVGADQTVAEESGLQTVVAWATAISPGPPDEAGQAVMFNVTGNTNPALFSVAPAVSPTGTLTYTPAADASGAAMITLTLSDDGGTADGGVDTSAPQSFTITVNGVNDPPSFTAGVGPSSDEDVGPQTILNWATSISPGPPSEAGQTLTFIVTNNTNAALFSAGPAVSSTGTLTYTSAPNAFGTADITLVLQDNGGTAGGGVDTSPAQTFTVTVTPVNDPPSLTASTIAYSTAGNTQLHVAGRTLPGLTATTDASGVLGKSGPVDIDGPAAPTAVPLSNLPTPNGTITVDADGSFSYVPDAGFVGTDSFTVEVTDSVTPVNVTVNVAVSDRVWYVNNHTDANNPAGGDGRSTDAFETLADAATASADNDIIFVFDGDSSTTPLTGGIALENGQKLHGEGVGLTVGAFSLVPAGTRPRITAAGDTVSVLASTANGDRTGVEIRGLNLTSIGGNAIDATSANASSLGIRISENTISGSGGGFEGIDITQASTGAATLDVHANTITAGGSGIGIVRTAGTATITAFSDNVVTGSTVGSGVIISGPVTFDEMPGGALDPVTGGTTLIGQSGNGVGGAGLSLTSITGALDFVDLEVFADVDAALLVTGTGGFNGAAGTRITSTAGASTLVAAAGPAVSLSNLTTDLQLTGLTSTNSGSDGVSLTNVGGTFTAPAGSSITNASGTAFNIGGGSATTTYGGTITDDIGPLVAIAGTTGGTKTFTGAITDGNDGDGAGIALAGNTDTTIVFSGGLTLSTGANPAFAAIGGGTVTVTDPAGPAVNTIATTTGTALNVSGTTIGAGGLVFQSIAANGATNGIVLNTTGSSGGLSVTGTGTAGSGGTIQGSTSPGISLTSTAAVSLSYMNIQSGGDDGIRGNGVSGLTLSNVNVTGNGNAVGESGIDITELTGSGGMTNVTVSGSGEHNVHIANTGGTLTTFNVTGSTFATTNFVTGSDGLLVEQNGTGTVNFSVTGSTFTDNKGDHFQVASQASAAGAINFTFSGNTLTTTAGNDPNVIGGGITISPSGSTDVTFTIDGNTINQAFDEGINLNLGTASTAAASMIGTISNNVVGMPGEADSGSESGTGINVTSNGAGTTTVAVTGNEVYQYANPYGILLSHKEGSSAMNVTVTGNTVTNPGSFAINGIRVDSGATASDTGTMCAAVTSNGVAGSGPGTDTDIRLRQRFGTTIRLPSYAGAADDTAAVNAFVAGSHAGADVSSAHNVGGGGGGFVGGVACPTPP